MVDVKELMKLGRLPDTADELKNIGEILGRVRVLYTLGNGQRWARSKAWTFQGRGPSPLPRLVR